MQITMEEYVRKICADAKASAMELYGADGLPIPAAPHPAQIFFCAVPFAVREGDIMRSGDAESL